VEGGGEQEQENKSERESKGEIGGERKRERERERERKRERELLKIAIIALYSDEVRTMCKILWNFSAVQMIQYQFNLRFTIKQKSGYIFQPIYHLTG